MCKKIKEKTHKLTTCPNCNVDLPDDEYYDIDHIPIYGKCYNCCKKEELVPCYFCKKLVHKDSRWCNQGCVDCYLKQELKRCDTCSNSKRDKLILLKYFPEKTKYDLNELKCLSCYRLIDEKKQCSRCLLLLDLDKFNEDRNLNTCKSCVYQERKPYKKAYYSKAKNKSRYLRYLKKYRTDNAEEIRIQRKTHRSKSEIREKIKIYNAKYRKEHAEQMRRYKRAYKKRLREKAKQEKLNKFELKKELLKMKAKDKRKERIYNKKNGIDTVIRARDIDHMLISRLKCRTKGALKNIPIENKTGINILNLLGCTIFQFKMWLKFQLRDGMYLDDPKSFHIDHIIPCASFNLFVIENRYRCFSWTNMQPLTPFENLSKGKKYLPDHVARAENNLALFLNRYGNLVNAELKQESNPQYTKEENINQIISDDSRYISEGKKEIE